MKKNFSLGFLLMAMLTVFISNAAWSQNKNVRDPGYLPPVDDEGQYIYVTGQVKDAVTNKPVPGVPILITANFQTYTILEDGAGSYYGSMTKQAMPFTDANGNYTGLFYREQNVDVTVNFGGTGDGGYAVEGRRTDTYIGLLSRLVKTEDLNVISSDGANFLVRPRVYQNQVSFPITSFNTMFEFGFKALSKYIQSNVTHPNVSGYSITGTQPTISFDSNEVATVSFSITAKQGTTSIGSGNFTIKGTPSLKEVNGGLALALDWTKPNLTVNATAFNNSAIHQGKVKDLIDLVLEHSIYISPTFSSTQTITLPSPINRSIWNVSSLNSLTFSNGNLSIGVLSGWYMY